MATEEGLLDHRGLMAELGRLCQQKKSGTVLIATHDNHLARVLLDAGEIVSMVFGQKHGQEAIPLVSGITAGRIRFSDSNAAGTRNSDALPPTETVLRLLGAGTTTPVSVDGVPIGASTLKLIEDELIDVLGPMASLVWAEHLEKTANPTAPENLARLIDAVAAEIGDPTKIRRFKEQVGKKIRG